ncbi:MAG TPA: universal stress protein [Cyclobacteriaceae bacterium]|nr:universal stress protein [Cyclobacteriaceae bacterium]
MKNILVPTDFSENANTAIEYAAELASHTGAKITVVNIYTPAVTKPNIISPLIQQEISAAEDSALAKLDAVRQTIIEQFSGVSCETSFVVGPVVPTLEKLTQELDAQMLVMGTRGATGLDKILFGSNTAHMIEKSSCPVLAIPREAPYRRPTKIILATDFANEELGHITKLVSLAKSLGSEILMTHITTDPEAMQSEEMLKRNFAKRVSEATDYPSVSYMIKFEDDISRALQTAVSQVDADWIAMLTHHRTFFEKIYNPSMTKAMAYHTKIPLLALK